MSEEVTRAAPPIGPATTPRTGRSTGATGPGDLAPGSASLDGETAAEVLAEERALDVDRLRFVARMGAIAWAAMSLVHVPIALVTATRPLWQFIVLDVLGLGLVLVAGRLAARDPSGDGVFRTALALGFVAPSFVLAALGVLDRSVVSPFAHATLVLLATFAIAIPMPWRRALPWLSLITLSWPLGVLVLLAALGRTETALADPRVAADFRESGLAVLVGALLCGAAQHAQWTSRRELLGRKARHRYRIEEKLGEGGMGEVFRAHHPGLGRAVALKILKQVGDSQMVARFVREVRTTAELQHPGTVRILDCGATDDGHLYYTMELLSGCTLAQLVGVVGPLSPERAAYLVRAAARALAEAHARGLVHRDVKPENLFVATMGGEPELVKVLDFGIAKTLSAEGTLTLEGTLLGTPRYMSLEQAIGEPATVRTDVYALGAVLFFALTGTAPVEEPTVFAVVAAHASERIVAPSVRRPGVPPDLDAIVLRCLAGDPALRFADAAELVRALEATGLPDRHRPAHDPRIGPSTDGGLATGTRRRDDVPTKEAARG